MNKLVSFYQNYPLTVLALIILLVVPVVSEVAASYNKNTLAECQKLGNSFTQCQKLFN